MMRIYLLNLALLALCSTSGCATVQPHLSIQPAQAHHTLQAASKHFDKPSAPDLAIDSLLVLDSTIQADLLTRIPLHLSEKRRFNRLVQYFNDPAGLGLTYDADKTLSASQTYYQRTGNCLSMASLFVAMARTLKLEANINEVQIPPLWQNPKEKTYQLVLHVNASVKLHARAGSSVRDKVVEFNSDNYNPYRRQKTVSDNRLMALYLSNKAIEAMLDNNTDLSFNALLQAINLEPSDPILWTNMGSILKRANLIHASETAFLYSLKLDPSNHMASSALARLYRLEKNDKLAKMYLENAHSLRANNPYIQIEHAKVAFQQGQFQQAIKLTYKAIEKQKYEHSFYQLLGLCYLQLKEYEHAANSFKIAKAIAITPQQEKAYQHKLDLIVHL